MDMRSLATVQIQLSGTMRRPGMRKLSTVLPTGQIENYYSLSGGVRRGSHDLVVTHNCRAPLRLARTVNKMEGS